jgi:hypothetical protein
LTTTSTGASTRNSSAPLTALAASSLRPDSAKPSNVGAKAEHHTTSAVYWIPRQEPRRRGNTHDVLDSGRSNRPRLTAQ